MLPVNRLIFDSTISAVGEWQNVSNFTGLSIQFEGVESNVWIEASNGPGIDGDTVLFTSDFPDASSWPLPSPPWGIADVQPSVVWQSPNDVHAAGDGYSSTLPGLPVGVAGGSVSAVVHGTGVAGGGFGFYWMNKPLDADFPTASGYWLFLDSTGIYFQKFVPPSGTPVQDFHLDTSGPFVFPLGDHKYELRWVLMGATIVVSVYIDDVLTWSGVDVAPPVPLPQYTAFEPYANGGDIDVGSLIVTAFASPSPILGMPISGDLSAPSVTPEVCTIQDFVAKTALWSPCCLVWTWIRVCKDAAAPALETKAFIFGQHG